MTVVRISDDALALACGADAVAINADDAVAKANAWFALAGVE